MHYKERDAQRVAMNLSAEPTINPCEDYVRIAKAIHLYRKAALLGWEAGASAQD
jgi:hypothetical protein